MKTHLSLIKSWSYIILAMMDLFTIFVALSVTLSFMLSPCASVPISARMPHQQDYLQHSAPALPRKLKLHEETNVKTDGNGNKHYYMPYKMQEEALPDRSNQREARFVHARKGTQQEWMERMNTSQFFMMDYMPIRRRHPIHNKFLPVAP